MLVNLEVGTATFVIQESDIGSALALPAVLSRAARAGGLCHCDFPDAVQGPLGRHDFVHVPCGVCRGATSAGPHHRAILLLLQAPAAGAARGAAHSPRS